MNNHIIIVKNLGKKYNITHQRGGYIALRDVIAGIFKNPFSFLKHKARSAIGLEKKEEFWALKGVDFTVNKGEVIGIIGHNGSGKSTLLKILSQITPPTEGEITIHGKVGSLLEVGTGFHPELTGRENIFLNGAILGMHKKDIVNKFDKIVEFAGIEKFLDTPVKYYSSGMYVRLAFSVAAHMEPDILLVDEVLAVGDAEFQKKCLGKMEEITKGEGRTIIFVSHNMGAIEQLCNRCVLLKDGKIMKTGPTSEIIDFYLNKDKDLSSITEYRPDRDKEAQITKISILNFEGKPSTQISMNKNFIIDIEYVVFRVSPDVMLNCIFFKDDDLLLNWSDADNMGTLLEYKPGTYKTSVSIPHSIFNTGYYSLEISIKRPGVEFIDRKLNIPFEIINNGDIRSDIYNNQIPGKIVIPLEHTNKILS